MYKFDLIVNNTSMSKNETKYLKHFMSLSETEQRQLMKLQNPELKECIYSLVYNASQIVRMIEDTD